MYSQNNEEEVVQRYFDGHRGRLLDIGANDGETFSNSRALLLAGWCGVLVEPSSQASTLLKQLYKDRPDVECFRFGIAESTGPKLLHECGSASGPTGMDVGLLSTLVEAEKARWKDWKHIQYFPKEAWFLSFEEFMVGCRQRNIKKFEFISIDAEGYDWTILQQINLEEVGCRCLCIEHNGVQDLLRAYRDHARSYGLQERAINGENIIFVR